MILTEDDTPQRPKLPTDPSFGPTNRVPLQSDLATSGSSLRPSSPVPTLPPDYETSQAQQPSEKPRGGWRCWNGRVRKMVLYALVVYSTIALIIGIPTLMMVRFPFQPSISQSPTAINCATEVERTSQVQMGGS